MCCILLSDKFAKIIYLFHNIFLFHFKPNTISRIADISLHLGSGIQERNKWNMWKTAFKKFEGVAHNNPSNFLKVVFHKFYLVHSWIPWPIYDKSWSSSFIWL